ncbi:hypothetical protein QX201_006890 [Fusarium graminearum]
MARYPKKSKAKKGKPKCTLNKKICRKYSKETLEVLIQPDATEKFGMPEQYFGMAIAYWQTERMNSYQLNSIPLEKGQSDLEIQIISFLKRTELLFIPSFSLNIKLPKFTFVLKYTFKYCYQGLMQELLPHTSSEFSLSCLLFDASHLVDAYWTNPSTGYFISAQSSPVQPQLDHCRYVNFTKPLIIDTVSLPKDTSSSFIEKDRGNATWHTLLSAPGTISNSFTSGIATCPRNGALALHRHTQAEIYYILSGSGEVEVEGVRHSVSKGNLVWIPGDAEHGVFCGDDELKWLYIFPESSFDNIVYRFSSEMENAVKKIKSKL